MRLHKRQFSVLSVCCLLMSCSSSIPHESAPTPPQPAVLQVPCPALLPPADNSCDAIAVALKQLYDEYGLCAGRFLETLQRGDHGSSR
jgi:hypothetical protein